MIAGAFSPNGKQIAVVSNIGTFAFHVVLAPRTDFTLSPPAKVTSIGACQVNWRSDGQALAVMNPQGPCAPNALGDVSVVSLKAARQPAHRRHKRREPGLAAAFARWLRLLHPPLPAKPSAWRWCCRTGPGSRSGRR